MTAVELLCQPHTVLVAHRGDSRQAPENTLPAFESAIRLGVDAVELDYRHSADGVPMVCHDLDLDRHTDACLRFGDTGIAQASKTLTELRALDAGSWFSEAFAGTRLPTLEEALSFIGPRTVTMIERKDGDAATLVKLIERLGLVGRVVVAAFDWAFLDACRALCPGLILEALAEGPITPARLEAARAVGARLVGWKQEDLDADGVALIHVAGLRAWSWTIDEASRATQLVAWGLDGLITNVPGTMKPLLAAARAGI